MKIIYEDNDKIVAYKKAGQLVQGSRSFDVDMVSEIMTYRKEKKEAAYAAVINRLDRPVSGLVLFAKNKTAAARLSQQVKDKKYIALVCGSLDNKKGSMEDFLVKDAKDNISRICEEKEEGAKKAVLEYEVCDEFTDDEGREYSLVKIRLITGRHHQIRTQFASRGYVLAGDVKYGYNGEKRKRLYNNKKEEYVLKLKNAELALCSVELTADGKTYSCREEYLKKD